MQERVKPSFLLPLARLGLEQALVLSPPPFRLQFMRDSTKSKATPFCVLLMVDSHLLEVPQRVQYL